MHVVVSLLTAGDLGRRVLARRNNQGRFFENLGGCLSNSSTCAKIRFLGKLPFLAGLKFILESGEKIGNPRPDVFIQDFRRVKVLFKRILALSLSRAVLKIAFPFI